MRSEDMGKITNWPFDCAIVFTGTLMYLLLCYYVIRLLLSEKCYPVLC